MKLIFYILSFSLMSNCWGQAQFPINDIGIFDVTDENSTLRKEFLKEIQIVKDNYFVRTVNNEYILIFDKLYAARGTEKQLKSEDHHRCSIGDDFRPIGLLPESKFRKTYFFKRENGYWAMLTSWNVELSGAQVSFPKYLVNDTVGDKHVITVLAVPVADKLRRAVWKSVWHTAGILFELYIETTLNPPLMSEFDYSSVVKTLKLSSCLLSPTEN
jgi:hypothetical protein